MNDKKLGINDMQLFEIAVKKGLSGVRCYIRETYSYEHVSDKTVYRKLAKLALKLFSQEDLESFFCDYLEYQLDNFWNEKVDKSFAVLSNELIERMKKYV